MHACIQILDPSGSVNVISTLHINSDIYRTALSSNVPLTGGNVDLILKGVNQYLMLLAKEQIRVAFEQAEKEVDDLHQRTREGIATARINGTQIGRTPGKTVVTHKCTETKKLIKQYAC